METLKLLIIEDDADQRDLIRETLEDHFGRGTVTAVGNRLEALAKSVEEFDLILAMDSSNLADLQALAPGEEQRAKVRLLREFEPGARGDLDVPDPYYGAGDGFERVLDMVGASCRGLLARIEARELP